MLEFVLPISWIRFFGRALAFRAAALCAVGFNSTAAAHLMPAGRGTMNLIGDKAYLALSLPVSGFSSVPGCADGVLSHAELRRDASILREELRAHLVLESPRRATFERILMNLPTGYGHDRNRSPELIVMIVAGLQRAPRSVALAWHGWPASRPSPLTIRASVAESGLPDRAEEATLSRERPSHRFFAARSSTVSSWMLRGLEHLLRGWR